MNSSEEMRDSEEVAARTSGDALFPTTSWTVVRAAAGSDGVRSRAALRELGERYRAPVRAYLLHDGYSEGEADRLLARFFARLGKTELPRSSEPGSAPFRVWLLEALKDFLSTDPDPDQPSEADSAPVVESADENPRPTIPGYRLFDMIGVGGEGIVYRAYDSRAQRHVAVKILRKEFLGEPEVVERFQRSVALVATLDHPNIVRVHDRGGAADERPYCAMQLVVGGTLAERQQQERFRDPKRAARLLIKVARAVHHAHQHGILHRDLSPSNVLLDINGEPFVNDFMAKRIGQAGPSSCVGKLPYIAPEVAEANGGTVEADVYGLGAILYELWTGTAPIQANSFEELQRKHELSERRPARSLVLQIPPDLDAVCSAALRRDPKQRIASAAAFADSLERVLANFPPLWPKPSRRRRLSLWVRRNPMLAIGALLGALLLVLADVRTLASVRMEQAELETATLHGNAALASAQAHAVLTLFQKLATQVARTAVEPEIREFAEAGQIRSDAPALQRAFERTRSFDSIGVFSKDGRILARYPDPTTIYLGRDYRFREYHRCLEALTARSVHLDSHRAEPEVCVSPAYRGEHSHNIEFSFAAPLYAAEGSFIGYVLMNKHAQNTLEEIEIDDVYQSGQTTALFGQRDLDRNSPPRDATLPKKLTVVAHPGLFSTEERALDAELARKLVQRFGEDGAPGFQLRAVRVRPWEEANYVDPVAGGNWLAGFAPVGATGFVVSVATPRSKALGASERHIDALWRYALMLNLGFLVLGIVALRASLRDVPPGART